MATTASATTSRVRIAPIFRKQAQVQEQQEHAERSQLRNAFHQAGAAMFVSTRMEVITQGEEHIDSEVVWIGSVAHYRLTPLFWAYLHHAFDNATRACDAGKLDESTYRELLSRISRVYDLALAQFPRATLKSAEQSYSPAKWKRHLDLLAQAQPQTSALQPAMSYAAGSPSTSPAAYRFPADAVTGIVHPVSKAAIAQIHAIRDQAITLGWSMDQLYRNVGIASRDWGLVCYIKPGDRIGAITRQSIEIVRDSKDPGSRSHHFYNHEIEQPWLKFVNHVNQGGC